MLFHFIYLYFAAWGMQDLCSPPGIELGHSSETAESSPLTARDSSKILLYGHPGTAWSLEFLPNSSELPFVYPIVLICPRLYSTVYHFISTEALSEGVLLSPGARQRLEVFWMFKCLPKLYYRTVARIQSKALPPQGGLNYHLCSARGCGLWDERVDKEEDRVQFL